MKVICAGMSKTGTKSMHVALEKLGYSVHDYPDAFEHFETKYANFHDLGWNTSDFHAMYENVDAAVDGPVYFYWEELLEAFPEAKVVLTIRNDDEIWFKSFDRQLKLMKSSYYRYYSFISPSWRRFQRFVYNSAFTVFSFKRAHGFETYRQPMLEIQLKQAYRRHIAHVINKCPKDRLLVYNCSQGWKSLCEFLGKTVPNEPFPQINVGGKSQEGLLWQTDILKQATIEGRIGGCVIGLFLAALGCFAVKRKFLGS